MTYKYFLAKSREGAEFLYKISSALFVSTAAADDIAALLNAKKYDLKPGEVWYKHEAAYGDDLRIDRAIKRRAGRVWITRV